MGFMASGTRRYNASIMIVSILGLEGDGPNGGWVGGKGGGRIKTEWLHELDSSCLGIWVICKYFLGKYFHIFLNSKTIYFISWISLLVVPKSKSGCLYSSMLICLKEYHFECVSVWPLEST